ncbi:MAG: DNA polymerase I [Anaerolineae bacterium]
MSENPATRPAFYILDGHAIAYRQYFGLQRAQMTLSNGESVQAVYGFTRTLQNIILKDKPDYIAVSFDMGLSGRELLYPEYKGTREKMPEDLEYQLERINTLVAAFNIPILSLEGYEADDVIGTVVGQALAQDVNCHIITGDRDLLQLLAENITVQLPAPQRGGPDEIYDVARFIEKYTIRPDQLVDQKAMMGDSSDNIPGIRGIGEKTAATLLTTYGTLDGIYAHINEIKGSLQQKLIEGRESAYLSRELAAIKRDIPITLNLEACLSHDYDYNNVLDLYRELEFRTFSDELARAHTPVTTGMFEDEDFGDFEEDDFAPPARVDVNTVIVRDEEGLKALVDVLNAASAIAWDVETTSTDQMQAELVGISLSVDGQTGYYVPVGHRHGKQLPLLKVLDALQAPLTNPNIAKYGHNASYDLVVSQRYNIDVSPITFDTMIAEWLREPNSKHLGLKNLASHELQEMMTPISTLIGTGKNQKTMDEVLIEQAAPYAAADAAVTFRLVERLRPSLQENDLTTIYETLELPLIPVIADMERAGVALDVPALKAMSARLTEQMATVADQIYANSGGYGSFNINSPKQLNEVLFGQLGLSTTGLRKTTHGYSTDVNVLEKLYEDTQADILKFILEYRELSKLQSTYVEALPALINPHTGRVHTSYNQTGTSTGRISSSNPNLQNIPIRTEIGREVRRAFIAPHGKVLLAVDYSQIELRILAHISGEPNLLDAFAQGQDVHKATAAIVYGVPLDQVTYEQRSFAKRVNFGLIYGMGAFRLARESDLTLAEANRFIDTYFNRLPEVRRYIEETRQAAAQPEGLRTLFGRRRFFPTLTNPKSSRSAIEAELRAAINMPIQGTAADIMKRAMIDLHTALNKSELDAVMILQVHDELVLEVREDQLARTRQLVVEIMEGAYDLRAPLRANAQAGQNWRDMQPV